MANFARFSVCHRVGRLFASEGRELQMPLNGHSIDEPKLIGDGQAMEWLRAAAARVAAGNAKVLITGESGVGKDLVARYIHTRSQRAGRPFVAVNCAGISETLLESELFGHVRGSFTGAHRDKTGLFQLGHRGTVFLDEVGEMSLRMQALLLRFLENGEVKPVGSEVVSAKVDVRVIAATNRDLREMVATGQFREDLMYRIMVVHLQVPPLRERADDIRAILAYLVAQTGSTLEISDEAMEALERYPWPGNVRELQNLLEQLVWLHPHTAVGIEDLPPAVLNSGRSRSAPAQDRRKRVSDHIYDALVDGGCSFWEHVYPMFINRDLTRKDLTEVVRRGLVTTRGNYRALLELFGMAPRDYKRFLNLLSTHGCTVNFREYRLGKTDVDRTVQPAFELPGSRRTRKDSTEKDRESRTA
jgi:transcriptional regulator with PAS, ATPase and Fis domain